jgi:hypothetical protein
MLRFVRSAVSIVTEESPKQVYRFMGAVEL